MRDQILVLLKFVHKEDNSDLHKYKLYLDEDTTIQNFKEEISEVLEINQPKFKIVRIMFIDKDFDEEMDLPLPPANFLFEEKQKFIIICEIKDSVDLLNAATVQESAAVMSISASVSSINMEESDVTTENTIKSIMTNCFGDLSVPRFTSIWRKKVVRLIGAHLMLN
jgi:hypothetical protein